MHGKSSIRSIEKARLLFPFLDIPKAIRGIQDSSNSCSQDADISMSDYYHVTCCRYEDSDDPIGLGLHEYYMPFLSALTDLGVNFSSNIVPLSGHDAFFFPSHVIGYSEKTLSLVNGTPGQRLNHSRRNLIYECIYINALRLQL